MERRAIVSIQSQTCMNERTEKMEPKYYTVSRIEGEYAYLREEASGNELFIALALLPSGTDEGSRLSFVFPDYELL